METSKSHKCLLPSPKEIWTIHGVWPTRFGSIGPAFCNKSATFDIDQLEPFMDQLEQFWINIEEGKIVLLLKKNVKWGVFFVYRTTFMEA